MRKNKVFDEMSRFFFIYIRVCYMFNFINFFIVFIFNEFLKKKLNHKITICCLSKLRKKLWPKMLPKSHVTQKEMLISKQMHMLKQIAIRHL